MERLRELTIERLKMLEAPSKQLAFAYSACYRMFPNYQYFHRKYSWGDELCLIHALEAISNFILDGNVQYDIPRIAASVSKNTPNSDNFNDAFSTYAQNAANSIAYALDSLLKLDVQELAWSLVISRDTVDAYVIGLEENLYDPDFEARILGHPVMKRELQKQESDFLLLKNISYIDKAILESLLEFNNGRSNIDVARQ